MAISNRGENLSSSRAQPVITRRFFRPVAEHRKHILRVNGVARGYRKSRWKRTIERMKERRSESVETKGQNRRGSKIMKAE